MARVIIMNWLRFCLISLLASSIAGANVGLSSEGASEPLPSGGVQTSSSESASEPLPSGGVQTSSSESASEPLPSGGVQTSSSEGASEPLPSGGVQTSSSEGASEPLPSGGVSDRGPSEEYESPGIKSDGSWSWLEYFYIKLKTDIEKLINLFSLE